MTQVTETVTRPGGAAAAGVSVRYELVGASRAFVSADDETVVGKQPTITTDVNGEYTIDLPANTSMEPEGTRWRRTVVGAGIDQFSDDIIVPSGGGPYVLEDVLADSLAALPTPVATNDLDRATLTANFGPTAVNLLSIVAVTGLVVDVPDLAVGCYVKATALMSHSAANAAVVLVIAPVGASITTDPMQQATATLGAAATKETVVCELYLPAHSAGSYQVFVLGTSGNLTVEASADAVASLVARSA